jgi:ribosomal protein S18 acetylase RimI-like enzyme
MKKGTEEPILIREITVLDAPAFLALRMQTEKETEMMGYRAGERKETALVAAKKIQGMLDSKNQMVFVATSSTGALVGFIMVTGPNMKTYLKTRSITIGVLKKYWRKGIGSQLMSQAIVWAKKKKFHRLELYAWGHNASAMKLYRKFGFKKEGVKKEAAYIGRTFVDAIPMGLILE